MYPPFIQPETRARMAEEWLAAGREARRATLESSRPSGAATSTATSNGPVHKTRLKEPFTGRQGPRQNS